MQGQIRRLAVACACLSAVPLLTVACGTGAGVVTRDDGAGSGRSGRVVTVSPHAFTRTLRLHGTIEAVDFHIVVAPRLVGDQPTRLVITSLAPNGASVRRGDVLVTFDTQNQLRLAFDKRAEWRDFEEQINKLRAEHAALAAADATALQLADNAVAKAELELRKNDLLPRIEAEKNLQTLEAARARAAALRETFELKARAREAERRILEVQRDRAALAMQHAEENADRMAIASPLDGLVVVSATWRGGQRSRLQEGEELWPGEPILQVVGPSQMRVRVAVNQVDRAALALGQRAVVRLDAFEGVALRATLVELAPVGLTSSLSEDLRTFDAVFAIEDRHASMTPDLSAAVDVELERLDEALTVPREAVLGSGDAARVVVVEGGREVPRSVTLGPANEVDVIVTSGLSAGDRVIRRPGATEPSS